MSFSSLQFLIFLPIVCILYFATGFRLRKWLLLAASYYFYMVFSIPLVLLLIWSTIVDFTVARLIERAGSRGAKRWLLLLSIVSNLGMLGFFKYYNFLSFSLASISGIDPNIWLLPHLLLPMGISFYTFQTLSYTIDVYRGAARASHSALDVALYVAFFPQLVAGPIMRGSTFLPQFSEQHHPHSERMLTGMSLCVWGLLKKSFIADPMGEIAGEVYGPTAEIWQGATTASAYDPGGFSSLALLIATYAFAIQIYCDFSAYTDIARGAAQILGFRLMRNFDSPYLAMSIQDFWRRWHISLSTWLRDYLYIPLGGNRKGRVRTYVNLMITMLLGGLWHGANWTFVIWGGLHGLYLAVERFFSRGEASRRVSPVFAVAATFVTFHLVCLAWIFFRANTVEQAFGIVSGIASLQAGKSITLMPLAVLAVLLTFQAFARNYNFNELVLTYPTVTRFACYVSLILLVMVMFGSKSPEFIYFQF